MIRFFLLQNRAGKTRLSKWCPLCFEVSVPVMLPSLLPLFGRYAPFDEDERRKIENEVHRHVTSRDAKLCNFIEVHKTQLLPVTFEPQPRGFHSRRRHPPLEIPSVRNQAVWRALTFVYPSPQYRNYKIIYRRYAGLFFTICCDPTDNEARHIFYPPAPHTHTHYSKNP